MDGVHEINDSKCIFSFLILSGEIQREAVWPDLLHVNPLSSTTKGKIMQLYIRFVA